MGQLEALLAEHKNVNDQLANGLEALDGPMGSTGELEKVEQERKVLLRSNLGVGIRTSNSDWATLVNPSASSVLLKRWYSLLAPLAALQALAVRREMGWANAEGLYGVTEQTTTSQVERLLCHHLRFNSQTGLLSNENGNRRLLAPLLPNDARCFRTTEDTYG
ncbi:hypothetical protein BKA70DRAFT_198132 [Coprinopsis sp. MPI-PUGE-AT-0042]|nr:hypothetical protein BKA70DRAFT_198132 [Coprinopsis sp. MPI-PUGE-AT-0042]